MPEQLEALKRDNKQRVNMAINACDNGYVIQGEVQYIDADDNQVAVERRTAVARGETEVTALVGCFMLHRSFGVGLSD